MSACRSSIAREDKIAIVPCNRPERRIAFDLPMWRAVHRMMDDMSADDTLCCAGPAGDSNRGSRDQRLQPDQQFSGRLPHVYCVLPGDIGAGMSCITSLMARTQVN
jgi:hypothetical protein